MIGLIDETDRARRWADFGCSAALPAHFLAANAPAATVRPPPRPPRPRRGPAWPVWTPVPPLPCACSSSGPTPPHPNRALPQRSMAQQRGGNLLGRTIVIPADEGGPDWGDPPEPQGWRATIKEYKPGSAGRSADRRWRVLCDVDLPEYRAGTKREKDGLLLEYNIIDIRRMIDLKPGEDRASITGDNRGPRAAPSPAAAAKKPGARASLGEAQAARVGPLLSPPKKRGAEPKAKDKAKKAKPVKPATARPMLLLGVESQTCCRGRGAKPWALRASRRRPGHRSRRSTAAWVNR